MISLLAAFGIACLAYGLVAVLLDPVAAILPAFFALTIALVILWRRASRGVQDALMPLEPLLRGGKVAEADVLLVSVSNRWSSWMPLLKGQLAAQRGMLLYMQSNWDDAMPLLMDGKWRNWMAQACIGCIHHRRGEVDEAFEFLARATKSGKKEPLAWVVRAVLLSRAGRRDEALQALSVGLTHLPEHRQLVDLKRTLANKKKVNTALFGQGWYQFFPEELAQKMRGQAGPRGPNFGPGFRGPKTSKQMRRGR